MSAESPISVLLISSLPPPIGGISVWTKRFLNAAMRQGIDVRFRNVALKSSVETFRRNVSIHARRLWRDWAVRLAEAVRTDASVVHVCVSSGASFVVGLTYAIAARVSRTPTIVHLHGRVANCWKWSVWAAATMASSRGVTFVTPSRIDAEQFPFMQHINNFVPAKRSIASRPHFEQLARLVFCGWITRPKGIFELTRALAPLKKLSVDLYGPIIRPAELADWQALVCQVGVEGRIRYMGVLDDARVPEILSDYDAMIWPSHSEAFGLAAAEAMMMGIPLIATRTGFLADVDEDHFVPIPINHPEGLRLVLEDLCRDPARLRSCAIHAQSFAEREFSEEHVLKTWVDLYHHAISAAG